jgi:hypothetical protein
MNLIDWILDLFRSEDMARSFVAAPEQTLRDAGLAGVSAGQLASVASTAVPGLVLSGGDPIFGLQRAVSNQYGFAPAYDYSPAPTYAPSPTFAPQTDLASHNDTALLSPDQSAGANAQQGGFNIVSGDGAVLGNNNDVSNGDVYAGTGSNVALGHSTIHDSGTTATGNGTVIKDNDGPVLHDVDASGGNGGGASAGSGGGLLGIGGSNAHAGNAGGGGIVINDTSSHESQTAEHNSPTHDSLFDTSVAGHHDTSLDNGHELALASGASGAHLPGF